jgi:FkbM family methyltransferase
MSVLKRVTGALSRRLDRPELLAAIDPGARRAQEDAVGIAAVLACGLAGDGTYVDVGTNRGQVLRDAVRVAPRGRHIAFEPIPGLAAEVARAYPGVDCRQLALGAKTEVAEFCHYTELDGWSGLRSRPEISEARGGPQYITVTVATLDEQIGDITPSVVKIDVEGAELGVLEGGRAVLARACPLVIFEHELAAASLYGVTPGAPWDLLDDLGYVIFTVTGKGPFTRAEFVGARGVVNWLAVPTRSAGPGSAG